MTAFLKGDDTAIMTLALAEGFDYSGRTVCLEYQGVVRSFPDATAGDVLFFAFTAGETAPMALGAYPVRVWIEGADGSHTTIHNSAVKFRVTDNPADVRTDGEAIYIDAQGSLHGIEGLPARWTESDLRAKVNEIIRRLGGAVAALALCVLSAFGAGVSVQSAPKGAIYNDAPVATNVVFDASGLATESYVDAKIAAIPGGGVSTNEVLAIVGPTIEAEMAKKLDAARPDDYDILWGSYGLTVAIRPSAGIDAWKYYIFTQTGLEHPEAVARISDFGVVLEQFASTGTVANANYAVRADSTDTAFSAYWLNASGSYLKWGGDRWGYDRDGGTNFYPFAYLSDVDAAASLASQSATNYTDAVIYALMTDGGRADVFAFTRSVSMYGGWRFSGSAASADYASRLVHTDLADPSLNLTLSAGSIGRDVGGGIAVLEPRWIAGSTNNVVAYLSDFSTNNTALVETIAATAGGGKASGLELVDENNVAWTLGVNTNGTIFTYIKEANP